MKTKKSINLLVIGVIVLSAIAALIGVFSNTKVETEPFESLYKDDITLYGKGIYWRDSVSIAAQAIAQDIVTLLVGIPLLIVSLRLFQKELLKGKLLLLGTLGYFLYAYTSYTFLSMYNALYLIYVALMSFSFYAFVLTFLTIDISTIKHQFKETLPTKRLGGFLLFVAFFMGMMWLNMITLPLINGEEPEVIQHYTTLVIQALDLGFVVPTAVLGGILLIKKRPYGYVLAPLVIIKAVTMLTAMTAMVINEMLNNSEVDIVFVIAVPILNLLAFYMLDSVLRHIREEK